MINVQDNPLKNLTFPSEDFDHYRFIQWLGTELSETNHCIQNPEAIKAERVLSKHIKALNLSKNDDMQLDAEYGSCAASQNLEGFVNGYLTAMAIIQGRVL